MISKYIKQMIRHRSQISWVGAPKYNLHKAQGYIKNISTQGGGGEGGLKIQILDAQRTG